MSYSSWPIFDGSRGTDTCLPSSVQFLVSVLKKLCVIIPVFTTNLTFVVVFCEFQVLGLADIGPYITKIPPSLIWVNNWISSFTWLILQSNPKRLPYAILKLQHKSVHLFK